MEKSDKLRVWYGPLMILLSAVAWSFSGVLSKGLSWNGFSKAGVRGVIAVFIFACARRSFKVKLTPGHILGALGVSLTSLLYMTAIRFTTSANAIVLQYSMPVYVILLLFILYRRKPSVRDMIAVPFVLLGVILCCMKGESGGEGKLIGDILALISGLTFALVYVASRIPGSDPMSYSYLGNIFSAFMAVSIFFDPNVHFHAADTVTRAMVIEQWVRILLLGLSLSFGYLFLAYGIRHTPPVTAAIISNMEPVLNPVWTFLFIGEAPGILGIVGAGIVLITSTLHSCLPSRKEP
ncbi:MAG: DMT family transporter [Clostridia bacterium]|nr:DMT family transporter [Clostridia bacterium]